MIFNVSGGGGAALNFRVVGGTTAPTNAAENCIWVNTNKINNYYFSATEPRNVVDYDVWISTGTKSNIAFNALKKNGIQVYPISAKQYVSGAWVDLTAKSYQGSGWVDWWNGELYEEGNEFEYVTGGWTGTAKKSSSTSSVGAAVPTITRNDVSISVKATNNGGGIFHTANKIDLSKFSRITFNGSFSRSGSTNNLVFACWPNLNAAYYTTGYGSLIGSPSAATTIELDISTVNEAQYVGIGIVGDSNAVIESILLT